MKELDKTLLQQLSRLQATGCPFVGKLGDFLDGKSNSEERHALEDHLRGCPACMNRLIDLRELTRLEQEGEDPPTGLINEVKRLVPRKQDPDTDRYGHSRGRPAVAVVSLLL